ncbi:biotin attachment protein [Solidesulfovibrio sp. C21]|uniref:biotin attachment protein n=1 Tax=Solidesulfovibrio sp. C21 TaxID=3398613 RepID=UPI0039FDD291
MIDVKALLEKIKASPYEEIVVTAPHTGVVRFVDIDAGARVVPASGTYGEKPGTLLARLTREHNDKPIYAEAKGAVGQMRRELEGTFVEAGTELAVIRHYLSKDEVIASILQQVLYLFRAPERAKYYFIPSVDKKVKASGPRSVTVRDGMELFIVSRMKREKPLTYEGPEGIIYAVYFQHDRNVDQGAPLVGVCPESQTSLIQDVVNRVRTDWEERE